MIWGESIQDYDKQLALGRLHLLRDGGVRVTTRPAWNWEPRAGSQCFVFSPTAGDHEAALHSSLINRYKGQA